MRVTIIVWFAILSSCSAPGSLAVYSSPLSGSEAEARNRLQATYDSGQPLRYYDREERKAYFLTDDERKLGREFEELTRVDEAKSGAEAGIIYRANCIISRNCSSIDNRFCSGEASYVGYIDNNKRGNIVKYFTERGYPVNYITFADKSTGQTVSLQYYTDCKFLDKDLKEALAFLSS